MHEQLPQKRSITWAKTTLCLALCFCVHLTTIRLFTSQSLGLFSLPTLEMRVKALISGLLSDVWMGVVCSLFFSVVAFAPRKIFFGLLFVTLLFVSLFIPYTAFFGNLIGPMHMKYVGDGDFWTASVGTFADYRIWISCAVSLAVYLFVNRNINQLKKKAVNISLLTLILLGIASQVIKVQVNTMKIGWGTPKVLRVNFIENLILEYWESDFPFTLTRDEFVQLTQLRVPALDIPLQNLGPDLGHLMGKIERQIDIKDPFYNVMQKTIRDLKQNQQPFFIGTVLLESVRPLESKIFTPSLPFSYTPFLDSLTKSSILYKNAFTVGDVTRAGQEAVLCGLMTGALTSAMRNLSSIEPDCVKRIKETMPQVNTWWWHGGNYNFDGQGTFWQRHGMDNVISKMNFPPNLPGTFWGMSDLSLVERVTQDLQEAISQGKKQNVGMILTLTNHSDWGVPNDASPEVRALKDQVAHPHQATTLYTDMAVASLVEKLKKISLPNHKNLWENTLLFIVNDHGSLLPSTLYPQELHWGIDRQKDLIAANATSHAYLLATGGLVEEALKQNHSQNSTVEKFVSQADIFPTILEVLDVQSNGIAADPLFIEKRRWPVVSDLTEYIYFPEQQKIFSRQEAQTSPDVFALFFKGHQIYLRSGEAGRPRKEF